MSSLLLKTLQQDSQTIHELLQDESLTQQVRDRLTALNMLLEGDSLTEIESRGVATKQTMNKWISQYVQNGLDAITTSRRSSAAGAAKFYTDDVVEDISVFLEQPRTLEDLQAFMATNLEREFKSTNSLKAGLNNALSEHGKKLVAVSYYVLQDVDSTSAEVADTDEDDDDTQVDQPSLAVG